MHIVHLASGNIGGAKLAAINLAAAQVSSGLEATVITNDSKKLSHRLKSKMNTAKQQLWQNDPYLLSARSSSQLDLKKLMLIDPDVVHVHNWFNLVSVKNLIELGERYPIICSLHDERLFTGGCHLTYSCNGFINECIDCPAVFVGKGKIHENSKVLKNVLESIPNLGVVSPSEWLAKKFLQSSIGRNLPKAYVIPNLISYSGSEMELMDALNSNKLRIGFVSANLNEPLKNLINLYSALDQVSHSNPHSEIQLFTAGGGTLPKSDYFYSKSFGLLKPDQMSNFWKNVDVLIVPSITENFPTVIAEAAYRAIPVIATNVGGIPEMITHGENGLLIEATVNSIASGIKVFLDLPNYERNRLGKNNLEYFHKTFDRTKLLNSYTKTYAEVIAGNAS